MSNDPSSHGLTGVAKTLLTPLYGRAHADRLLPGSGFHDPLAATVLAATGFRPDEVLTDRSNAVGAVHRAIVFDRLVAAFLRRHPDGVVVSAGVGLCTRDARLAGTTPPGVRWIGIDAPEVVELRRRLLPDSAVRLRAGSITDPDWVDAFPAEPAPTLVVVEGVLMYLTDREVARFLADVRARLGPGAELVADFFHPWVARSGLHPIVRATGARFRSGARGARGLASVTPGWTATAEYPVMERIGTPQRIAAALLRVVLRGHRPYAVADLRTAAREPRHV
ncbi:class I SAM-dependent methyltransferase [Kitasatospora sp. NPDC059327]|uniref:class I SAM-dependent methyltransferase n=1 Tax=Kitasatospora sp. NPDC059327 TaxID=3346803 RepID=UPI00367A8424